MNQAQPNPAEIEKYSRHYSDDRLMTKLSRVAKKLGIKIIYPVLLLFFLLKSPNVPIKKRAAIIGTLGYFILPTDLIPDFLPLLGYTDDAAALAACIRLVIDNITPEIRQQAKDQLHKWFGDFDDETLNGIISKILEK